MITSVTSPDTNPGKGYLPKVLRDLQPSPKKRQVLAAFDAMKLLTTAKATCLLADKNEMSEQQEDFMTVLRVWLLRDDEKYFYDPSFKWYSRFQTPNYYRPGDPIPFYISCSEKDISKIGRYLSLPMANGYYEGLSCSATDISLEYNRALDAVTFCIMFRLVLKILVKEMRRGGRGLGEGEISSVIASLPFGPGIVATPLELKLDVPMNLLYTLFRGRRVDRAIGVYIKREEDEAIEYDIRNAKYETLASQIGKDNPYSYTFKYPRSFVDWISQNRLRIFAILRDGECWIDERVRQAVKESVIGVDIMELPTASAPRPSKQEIEQKSALLEEAMKIRDEDRKRLREIQKTRGPLSYSQWAERLWFKNKSKGAAVAFFKRMQEQVLLTATKKVGAKQNEGAIIVELTQKAKEILRAWDEHIASHR